MNEGYPLPWSEWTAELPPAETINRAPEPSPLPIRPTGNDFYAGTEERDAVAMDPNGSGSSSSQFRQNGAPATDNFLLYLILLLEIINLLRTTT